MITAIDKNTALILIDLQKGIITSPKAHPMAGVLDNAAKLVAAFHNAHLPVVIVNVNPAGAPWNRTRKNATQPVGAFKDDFLDITHEIKAAPGDIMITKHTWGAFFETTLREQLIERNVTGIVLGGVSTSIGVEGTARQAMDFGYNIAFASDAMTDNILSAHQHSLEVIFPRMGEIGTADEIIAKLTA